MPHAPSGAPSSLPSTLSLGPKGETLRVLDCRVCLGGEFGGNLDLRLDSPASLEMELVRRLSLRVPGVDEDVDAIGGGVAKGGLELTFGSPQLADLGEAPTHVSLLVDGKAAGELRCRVEGTRAILADRFTDPLEILGHRATSPGALLHTNRHRSRLLGSAAIGFALTAVGCLGYSLSTHGTLLTPSGALSAFFVFGLAVTGALCLTPHTELRFDPMRGVLEELHVRGGWRGRRVLERRELPASGFDHVRIEERWRSAFETDPDEDSIWILFLEGPVQWMGADGDVHLRGDAVRVGEHGSRFAARRRAAEIARSLGLRVLDNSLSG